MDGMMDLPVHQRSTLRAISTGMKIPISTLHRELKKGKFKRVSVSVKPKLTPENHVSRLRHILSLVDNQTGRFSSMMNIIHIDEKWFYLTKEKRNFYLHPNENQLSGATYGKG